MKALNKNKYKITVYDVNGNVVDTIERIVYEFNVGRTKAHGTYWGVNYKNSRPRVYGDSTHPNGLYITRADFVFGQTVDTQAIRLDVHHNHTFDHLTIAKIVL